MRNLNNHSQSIALRIFHTIIVSVLLMTIIACGGSEKSDGELPLDNALNLFCPDVGIARQNCILEDPENDFANTPIPLDDAGAAKFALHRDTPSPKSNFYLWGTLQARAPIGEHQYYTALALHRLYTQGGSKQAGRQAIRAYCSLLANYFDDVTFFEIGDNSIPQNLNLLTARNLYNPSALNLVSFFNSKGVAQEAIGEWGFTYTPDSDPNDNVPEDSIVKWRTEAQCPDSNEILEFLK